MLHCIANEPGLCAEPSELGASPSHIFSPALVRCTALPAGARMPRGLALRLVCVLWFVCLSRLALQVLRPFPALWHRRSGPLLAQLPCTAVCCTVLVCTALFCNLCRAFNLDPCFRTTRPALPCPAQHVQPCNGSAMPDEQWPRGAGGGFQRPHSPPARAAAG